MARMRANTSPNISSHRAGCTVRVSTSVGSWRSLRTSHSAITSVFLKKLAVAASGEIACGCAMAILSAKPASGASGFCSFTVASSSFQGIACIVDKHVVERCMLATHSRFEMFRCIERDDVASMHDSDTAAQAVGFFHRMGGQKNGHIGLVAQSRQMIPDGLARYRV